MTPNGRKTRKVQPLPDSGVDVPDSSSSGHAPLIHILPTAASLEKDGVDNPVFSLDETLSRPPSQIHRAVSRNGTALRRGSLFPTVTTLSVPKTEPRRHSLEGSGSLLLNPSSLDQPMTTLNIDQLSIPYTPHLSAPLKSPGWQSMKSNWSELENLNRKESIDSIGSFHSEGSSHSMSGMSTAMSERVKNLVRRFTIRTEHFKEKTIQPATPSSTSIESRSATSVDLDIPQRQHRLDSFVPVFSRASGVDGDLYEERYFELGICRIKVPQLGKYVKRIFVDAIDSQSKIYLFWLGFVTMAFMYNALFCTLRASFIRAPYYEREKIYVNKTFENCSDSSTSSDNVTAGLNCSTWTERVVAYKTRYYEGYETDENRIYWWICDYMCDFIYLIDIILVKSRIKFIKSGLMESDRKEVASHYLSKLEFKLDVLSLTPLDLFYLIPSVHYNSLLRLPRLLKISTFWEFYDRLDQRVRSAHIVRVVRTLTYMLFLIHVESCGYYLMSAYEGLKRNEWVYDGVGIAYIRCVYLATKTATSIGNNPKPTNQNEYLFMTVYWLSGVFVFAMLIGQIRDIFQSAGAAKTYYRETVDQTLAYMQALNVPKTLQSKVRLWFTYNWEHHKTLNENSLLEALPTKMKTDLAIHVHFNTLSKVQLFQDCDKNLLYDLVLKLNPILYLPMDYICRKGEVGTEMYIVMQGQVEVVGGENNSIVFATLHEGSVFGEISLLALAGGNRRTADVRSKGFSQLFLLSKADFEEAMTDYPEAQKILRKRAKKLLAQNAKKSANAEDTENAEEVITSRAGTPKLLKTVVKLVQPNSAILDYLGTRRRSTWEAELDQKIHGNNDTASHKHGWDSPGHVSEECDEILIVEQTERTLSVQSLERLGQQQNDECSYTVDDKACQTSITSSPRSSSTSNSNKDTPTHRQPACLTREANTLGREGSRPSSRISPNLSCQHSMANGHQYNSMMPEVECQRPTVNVPSQNIVVCDVEVHRNKSITASVTSVNPDGEADHTLSRAEVPDSSRIYDESKV